MRSTNNRRFSAWVDHLNKIHHKPWPVQKHLLPKMKTLKKQIRLSKKLKEWTIHFVFQTNLLIKSWIGKRWKLSKGIMDQNSRKYTRQATTILMFSFLVVRKHNQVWHFHRRKAVLMHLIQRWFRLDNVSLLLISHHKISLYHQIRTTKERKR